LALYLLYSFVVAGPEDLFHGISSVQKRITPDLTVQYSPYIKFDSSLPAIVSSRRYENGTPRISLYWNEGVLLFRLGQTAIFSITQKQILIQPLKPTAEIEAELRSTFFTYVLACWLEIRGFPCLHGASVTLKDFGIMFLAHKGVGKSTLTSGILNWGGELLSDDISCMDIRSDRVTIRPGPPFMRLSPSQLSGLGISESAQSQYSQSQTKCLINLLSLAPEKYCQESKPLHAIFILDREPTREQGLIHFFPVVRSEALFYLVNYSFIPKAVHSLGLQKARMSKLSAVVQKVPVTRIKYPSSMQQIPEIIGMIQEKIM
jgi:hypothetical protein